MDSQQILAGLKTAPKAAFANKRYLNAQKRRKALQEQADALRASADLWVPPTAARELVQRRKEYEAGMVHMLQMKHHMDFFNPLLQEIDPYLQLVRAEDNIEPGHPLKPGYWHVIRHNPGAPPSVMTVEGDNGEYMEPTSRIFEMLKKNDMWNANSLKEENRKRRQMQVAEDRAKERERESRQDEMMERWAAATRTQVSMLPGWSQNVSGRRARNPT